MSSKGSSRGIMHICHIIIGAAFLLLSTPQFDITEAAPPRPIEPSHTSANDDIKTEFDLEQCGIPSPLFYQPSVSLPTGRSPFDSICSSATKLDIDKSVCKLFKLLALNTCGKLGNTQAMSSKYYGVFSQDRSVEQVCADFNMIYTLVKSSTSSLLIGKAGTVSTLYYLAGEPSKNSICSLFCKMTPSHLVMCKGLDFLLMTYTNKYPKADPGGSTTIKSKPYPQLIDPVSKEGTLPVTGDNPESQVGVDPASKEGTLPVTGVNPESQVGVDPASKEGTLPVTDVNPESKVGVDPASKEGTLPVTGGNSQSQVGVDLASKEGTVPVTDDNSQSQVGVYPAKPSGIPGSPSVDETKTEAEDEKSRQTESEDSPEYNFSSDLFAGKDELDSYRQTVGNTNEQQTTEREEGGVKLDEYFDDVFLKNEKTLLEVPQINSIDEEESSSHFMAYSLIAIILIMATYIMYHNKQRIIAVIIEGRNATGRRRNNDGYQKLDQNLSDVMPSLQKSKEYKF